MEIEDIAGMLLLFAPAKVLEELRLNRENALEWIQEIEDCHEHHRVELAALALYYSARLPRFGAEYHGSISINLSTIYALVQLAKVEESETVEDLLRTVAVARLQVTMAKNRKKKEKPTWHGEAIAFEAKGLSPSAIAVRVKRSASQVRRFLNSVKK